MKSSYSMLPKLGAPSRLGIGDVDHDRRAWLPSLSSAGAMRGVELAIGQQQLGLAVLQAEGDQRRIEADVDRVQHRADHRRRVVRLQHGRACWRRGSPRCRRA